MKGQHSTPIDRASMRPGDVLLVCTKRTIVYREYLTRTARIALKLARLAQSMYSLGLKYEIQHKARSAIPLR